MKKSVFDQIKKSYQDNYTIRLDLMTPEYVLALQNARDNYPVGKLKRDALQEKLDFIHKLLSEADEFANATREDDIKQRWFP